MVGHAQRTLTDASHQFLAFRQVAVVPPLAIVETVGHHDAAAVDALPQAHGEWVGRV